MKKPPLRIFLASKCPPPGEGVHQWIFHPVNRALELGYTEEEATPQIEELLTREAKPNEIADAFRSARARLGQPGQHRSKEPRWPNHDPEQIEAAASGGPGLMELMNLSPSPSRGGDSRAEEIVDALFPGNPLICAGIGGNRLPMTRPREKLRGVIEHWPLIVPSAMSKDLGLTKAGRLYPRTLDNTGPRQHLVLEFDKGTLDQQAALLHHLANRAPMAVVTFSGSKSLHGWFPCAGLPQEQLERFMHYAACLGADTATWNKSQFVRIPDGIRVDSQKRPVLPSGFPKLPPNRQAVIYYNPAALEGKNLPTEQNAVTQPDTPELPPNNQAATQTQHAE